MDLNLPPILPNTTLPAAAAAGPASRSCLTDLPDSLIGRVCSLMDPQSLSHTVETSATIYNNEHFKHLFSLAKHKALSAKMSRPTESIDFLIKSARNHASSGEMFTAIALLDEALPIARRGIYYLRFEPLSNIAAALGALKQKDRALEILDEISKAAVSCGTLWSKAMANADIATALYQIGEKDQAEALLKEAKAIVSAILPIEDHGECKLKIIESIAKCGGIEEAKTLALSFFTTAEGQTHALISITNALAGCGKIADAKATLEEAKTKFATITNFDSEKSIATNFIKCLANFGEIEEAKIMTRAYNNDPWFQVDLLTSIIIRQHRNGDEEGVSATLQELKTFATTFADPEDQAKCLRSIAATQQQFRDIEGARETRAAAKAACSGINQFIHLLRTAYGPAHVASIALLAIALAGIFHMDSRK